MVSFIVNLTLIFCIIIILFFKIKTHYHTFYPIFKKGLIALIIVHFSMFLFHWYWSLNNGVDVKVFFYAAKNSSNWFEFLFTGTPFMSFLIFPFVKAQISYFTLFFLFSSISFIGFLYYLNFLNTHYNLINKSVVYGTLIFLLIPSFHFWTAAISKEAILFYLLTFLLFQIQNKTIQYFKLLLPLVLILMIRPYLFYILIVSFILKVLFNKKEVTKRKITLILVCTLIVIGSFPLFLDFLKVDNFTEIFSTFEKIDLYASKSNTSVSLQNTTYLERLVFVLIKPFFYNATTFFKFIISVENSFIIIFFYYLLKGCKKNIKDVIYPLGVSVLLILFYSTYMYNLGLASRMRIMFYPYLLYGLVKVQIIKLK